MIITELDPYPLPVFGDDPTRPKGLHVSQIIGDMCKRLDPARYNKHDQQGKPVPMDTVKVDAGLHFERGLERILVKQLIPGLFRPGPVKKDGIWCSPDGVDPATWRVVEYKLTWYSSNKPCPQDPVFWPWMMQMAAYCYVLESLESLLIPQFINGDYKPPKPIPPRQILIQWTEQDLVERWGSLVNHAKWLGWV